MAKIEEIRQTYLKDAETSGSKSKFGFFSVPPCATAGHNAFEQKKVIKDQNGRVKTEERNIYSGPQSTGMLKKSFFKYQTSVFQGDTYLDPGKHERKQNLLESKKLEGKDVYKPFSLSKTPDPKSAYEHIGEKPVQRKVKDVVDENGKVKTEERNICTNPQSKVEKEKLKEIKYVHDPYKNYLKVEKEEMFKSINLRGQAPFKSSSPVKEYFATSRELYGKQKISTTERSPKQIFTASAQHDGNFKPSCCKKFDTFSYPQYKPSGSLSSLPKLNIVKKQGGEVFKPTKLPNKFKPSPSISTMRSNVLRSVR